MSSPILTGDKSEVRPSLRPAPERAWRAVAWFGGALALIGWAEMALFLYPWGMGSREWEFGVTAQMLGSLPLPTIGMAALLGAAFAIGSRRGLLTVGVLLGLFAVVIWGLLVLHWLVVPIALKAPAAAQVTIRQTIGRATVSGVGFGLLYLGGAVISVARVTRSKP